MDKDVEGSNVRCRYCLQQHERTYEAIRHVLNAHPQQNVSILLEKSQNTFIPRTYSLKGEAVEYQASVEYDTCSGKLDIRTTNEDPGAAHKQLKSYSYCRRCDYRIGLGGIGASDIRRFKNVFWRYRIQI